MVEVCMPAPFAGDAAIHMVEWLARDGAGVSVGDPLFSIESDKAVVDIEAEASGTLIILEQAGQSFAPGHPVGRIDRDHSGN